MKPELILVGGGGHCKSCIDVIEAGGRYRIAGIVDIPDKLGQYVLGYEIIACDDDLPCLAQKYDYFLITIGQIRNPDKRMGMFENLKKLGMKIPFLVSPLAYVSPHARIGEGTVVMHHAVINADAVVGKNCIINTKSLIEHDAMVGDHCHISTACVVNGGARIGKRSFVGSNTVIREYVEMGEDSLIGSGLQVMKSLPSGSFQKT